MPSASGTSVKGKQLITVLSLNDAFWRMEVNDPSNVLGLISKYYGYMSVEANFAGSSKAIQIGGASMWTYAKLISLPFPTNSQRAVYMYWRLAGIPWVALTST